MLQESAAGGQMLPQGGDYSISQLHTNKKEKATLSEDCLVLCSGWLEQRPPLSPVLPCARCVPCSTFLCSFRGISLLPPQVHIISSWTMLESHHNQCGARAGRKKPGCHGDRAEDKATARKDGLIPSVGSPRVPGPWRHHQSTVCTRR